MGLWESLQQLDEIPLRLELRAQFRHIVAELSRPVLRFHQVARHGGLVGPDHGLGDLGQGPLPLRWPDTKLAGDMVQLLEVFQTWSESFQAPFCPFQRFFSLAGLSPDFGDVADRAAWSCAWLLLSQRGSQIRDGTHQGHRFQRRFLEAKTQIKRLRFSTERMH